jgi:short-subunit dehydrogenase
MKRISNFEGVNAIVTGASSGIGRIFARQLAHRGARVGLVARREPKLRELREEIEAAGGEALALPCDVTDRRQVEEAIARAMERFDHIDMLVNNAGYGRHRRFVDWDLDDMVRMMDVNVNGTLYFTRLLLPHMVQRQNGCIVFIASVAGKVATPDESVYAASKHAIVGLADAVGIEVEDDGVYVMTVCPGAIDTPFFTGEDLARMPPVAKNNMADPDKLVEHIFKALARGKHETTYPRFPASAYPVRAIAPEFMRRQVKKVTLGREKTD